MKRLHYADWNEVRITLTVKDIADVLNVCDTVALNLVRSGEIPAKKVAGQWRILKTDAQFHPEFKSRPDRPHPLFYGFVKAALEQMQGKENMDESL